MPPTASGNEPARSSLLSPQSDSAQPQSLLFVCTGNLCRSPAAETVFNTLAEEQGLPWKAESAGISAIEGGPVTENMAAALEEVGFYADAHRARKVETKLIQEADLILAMTPRHKQTLRVSYGGITESKLFTLPEYLGDGDSVGITDPLGYPISTHRASVRQMYDYVERLVGYLQNR